MTADGGGRVEVEDASCSRGRGQDRDCLPPHSELRPSSPSLQLPSPHPCGSQQVFQHQKQRQQCRFTLRISQYPPARDMPTCPQCNPHGDPAHAHGGGVCFASLGQDGRDGDLPLLDLLRTNDLDGSTPNMGSSLLADAQTWDPRHEGGTGRNCFSRPPPRPTDALAPECEPAACVKGRRSTVPSRRGERRPLPFLSRPYLGPSNPPGCRYPTAVVNDPLFSHRPRSACQYMS